MLHQIVLRSLAFVGAAFGVLTANNAVAQIDPKAVVYQTPDQFKWRDPTNQATTNQAILVGDPNKQGLYLYLNTFKPNRFGNAHYHPNDRYIMVVSGAGWRGTGTVVDPAHSTRVPKGAFMVDHALKSHWDGTKEETGAYLITGLGPATNIEIPKESGPYRGGDPAAATIKMPNQIEWKDNGGNLTTNLVGDPSKPGLYVQMLTWKKNNNSRPHFHPNDRYIYVLSGTWWLNTGTNYDMGKAVAVKEGTFVTHFGKQVHYDGAKDEETTIIVIGDGPATTTQAAN